jgi:hypothetical protein
MPRSNSDNLTPILRRQEIAAILGRGLHRHLMACNLAPADFPPDLAAEIALDVSAPGDPHVSRLTEPRA